MLESLKKLKASASTSQKFGIFFISILIGILIIYQYNSYQKLTDIVSGRDNSRDIFEEINLLLLHNQKLKEEIEVLRTKLENFSDKTNIAQTLEKEIQKNQKIAGLTNISGPGIEIAIHNQINGIWFIDLLNESFTAGAEAISINSIRIVDKNAGFIFSNNHIILNGVSLKEPYIIQAIGDPSTLFKILDQPGGIINRLKVSYPDSEINVEKKEIIEMKQII